MAKRKAGKGAAKAPADPIDTMLELVATTGWLSLSLGAVAQAATLPLAELYRQFPSKLALLRGFAARIDAAMLAALGPEPAADTPVKDRLFEALMARFDALAPHKDAMRVLARELPRDPLAALCFAETGLSRSLDWALASAQLDAASLRGALRRKVLGAVYLDSLRVWLADDSADLSRTMAHLDKRLGQVEGLLTGRVGGGGFFSRLRNKSTADSAST
jgi:AcrR family transcriptional regulator